jgi:pimeloyl-ACP methyl ester carboxylesterase
MSEPATRVASTDGVQLAVHDLGGMGPDVLLTHGTGFHGLTWRPLARRLSGFHAIAMDFRAHGDSTRPASGSLAWHGFSDDVLAVVDALGMVRPFAVGHSMGAAALLLAESARPGTFRALALYEPIVFPPEQDDDGRHDAVTASARRRRAEFSSRQEAFTNFAVKAPFDALGPDALRSYVDHGFADTANGTVVLKCAPADEVAIFEMARSHDAWSHLGEVSCPVLVMRGAIEAGSPSALAAEIARRLPRGELVAFDALGHLGPMERPEAVAGAVSSFFARR